MQCVEFRRELATDPHSQAADFLRHRAECARCAEAAERALAFERSLRRALEVPAPAQLADAALLAQATHERRRRATWRRSAMLALAACFALAVGLNGSRVEAMPLSAQAVTHLEREAVVLKMVTSVSADEVSAAFAKRGLTLSHVPEGISFVGCCPMAGHRTVHLLMPAGDDPVTVIYVVDEHAAQREDFARDGWRGRIVPLGAGSLVLVARGTAAFDRIEAAWRAANPVQAG